MTLFPWLSLMLFLPIFFFEITSGCLCVNAFIYSSSSSTTSHSFSFFFPSQSLLFLFSLNPCLSDRKFLLHFVQCWDRPIEPWHCLNLWNWRPKCWLILQHGCEQVSQLLAEKSESTWLIVWVCFPKDIISISTDVLVEIFLRDCSGEGRVLGDEDEENYCTSEGINGCSLVGFSGVDFRGHVTFCTEFCYLEHVTGFADNGWSEAEVSYFQIEVLVKEQVLWL